MQQPTLNSPDARQTANLFRRLAALTYDLFLLFAISILYGALLLLLKLLITGDVNADYPLPVQLVASAGYIVVLSSYYHICWRKQGQTLGMKAWRIRTQQPGGALPGYRQCWLRSALAVVSLGAAGLGYIWCLLPPHHHCWHDCWSGTETVLVAKQTR